MRQIPFKNNKGEEFLFVEVPKDAELIGRMDDDFWSYSSKSQGWGKFPLKGNWQLIAPLSEMNEELWKGVVDEKPTLINEDLTKSYYFRNYLYNNIQAPHIWKKSATESAESLLKSLDIMVVNPCGEKPKFLYEFGENGPTELQFESAYDDFDFRSIQWQQAEQKLFNGVLIRKCK